VSAPPSPRDRRRQAERRGRIAEGLAALLLTIKGFRILARRARTRAGELDLVARRGALVAFIEVKARPDDQAAFDALGAGQRRRIARAAGAFLAARPDCAGCLVRFDAILVRPWRWPLHIADAWRPDTSPGGGA